MHQIQWRSSKRIHYTKIHNIDNYKCHNTQFFQLGKNLCIICLFITNLTLYGFLVRISYYYYYSYILLLTNKFTPTVNCKQPQLNKLCIMTFVVIDIVDSILDAPRPFTGNIYATLQHCQWNT